MVNSKSPNTLINSDDDFKKALGSSKKVKSSQCCCLWARELCYW